MTDQRNTISVSINTSGNCHSLHFYGVPKLSGHKGTLNFPFDNSKPLFGQIEDIMIINNMCHNVTRVEPLNGAEDKEMFTVVYNLPLSKNKKN